MCVQRSATPLRWQSLHACTQLSLRTTGVPSSYVVSMRRTMGESPSGETEEIMTKTAPVASVGRMAGRAAGLKNMNSSQTIIMTLAPVPRRAYLILRAGEALDVAVSTSGSYTDTLLYVSTRATLTTSHKPVP